MQNISRIKIGLGIPKEKKGIVTIEYPITVQHILNVHNGKLDFIWLEKKDNWMFLN